MRITKLQAKTKGMTFPRWLVQIALAQWVVVSAMVFGKLSGLMAVSWAFVTAPLWFPWIVAGLVIIVLLVVKPRILAS